jgi:hypothetical protein
MEVRQGKMTRGKETATLITKPSFIRSAKNIGVNSYYQGCGSGTLDLHGSALVLEAGSGSGSALG